MTSNFLPQDQKDMYMYGDTAVNNMHHVRLFRGPISLLFPLWSNINTWYKQPSYMLGFGSLWWTNGGWIRACSAWSKPSLFAVVCRAIYTSSQRQIRLASAHCVLKYVPSLISLNQFGTYIHTYEIYNFLHFLDFFSLCLICVNAFTAHARKRNDPGILLL